MKRASLVVSLTALLSGATGCGLAGGGTDSAAPLDLDTITVSSRELRDGAPLPERFSCYGAGKIPPLSWSGAPARTKAVAVMADDPDIPSGAYVHWLILDISPKTQTIEEGGLPQGARPARNSAGKNVYSPPCNRNHSYRFTVYALSEGVGPASSRPLQEVLAKIAERTLARGRLTVNHIE